MVLLLIIIIYNTIQIRPIRNVKKINNNNNKISQGYFTNVENADYGEDH